jgi:hypothetical protein
MDYDLSGCRPVPGFRARSPIDRCCNRVKAPNGIKGNHARPAWVRSCPKELIVGYPSAASGEKIGFARRHPGTEFDQVQ